MTYLAEYLMEFLSDKACEGCSKNTIQDYYIKIDRFVKFSGLDLPISDLDVSICKRYYLTLRCELDNTVSIQSYIRPLRAFLNWLYANDHITVDICSRFKLPKAQKPVIDVLTDSEIASIYECFPNDANVLHLRNKVIISLMLDCGLRLDEVVTAQRSDLHLRERYLIVTGKGNKQRMVAFGTNTASILGRYTRAVPPSGSLLLTSEGLPITRDTIKNMFRRLCESSGVTRLYPHLLRHTFATRYLENGGNIYALQQLLGHSSLDMVKKYLHLSQRRLISEFERFSPVDCLSNIKKPSTR